ncbi:MAG: histidine kinase [Candidatus Adiutrix sp.]|jgi:mannose-6-phosphate isomerase-like protein (cupin superfamily)/ligand-binding sensor protein|nr:histidine kinase [Candidatus Adiutrix sp.]
MPVTLKFIRADETVPADSEPLIVRPREDDSWPRGDQQFDWGHMQWLVDPGRAGMERIGVGFTTFYINGVDMEHYHMGSTQVVYIVSGYGHQEVNGVYYSFRAGDTLYIPPYSRHVMANDSPDEDLLVLGVYIPINEKPFLSRPAPKHCRLDEKGDILSLIDVGIIEDLLNRLSRTLNQSIKLIAHDGACLISSSNQPRLCQLMRDKCGEHCRGNFKKAVDEIAVINKSDIFVCCGRVASIITPIVNGNVIRGFLKCGEFFLNSGDREETVRYLKENRQISAALAGQDLPRLLERISVDKKHAVHAAAEDTLSVARCIAEMSVDMARQRDEEQTRLAVLEARMAETRLKQALQEADLKLLEAQLNPHFLFNTLNTIEHLAYLEGAKHISNLVLSLGQLLRTALGKTRSLIPAREEMELLRGYLDIQKARFGQRLRDRLDLAPAARDCLIPGLTLQPLVENSIQNSVESGPGHCLVEVEIRRREGRLWLTVADNGPGLVEGRPEGVGLRSVRVRLAHYFGGQYRFDLRPRPGGGSIAEISLQDQGPGEMMNDGETYETDKVAGG